VRGSYWVLLPGGARALLRPQLGRLMPTRHHRCCWRRRRTPAASPRQPTGCGRAAAGAALTPRRRCRRQRRACRTRCGCGGGPRHPLPPCSGSPACTRHPPACGRVAASPHAACQTQRARARLQRHALGSTRTAARRPERARSCAGRTFIANTACASVSNTSLTLPCAPRPSSLMTRYWLTNTLPCMHARVCACWRACVCTWAAGSAAATHAAPPRGGARPQRVCSSTAQHSTARHAARRRHMRTRTRTRTRTCRLSTTSRGVSRSSSVGRPVRTPDGRPPDSTVCGCTCARRTRKPSTAAAADGSRCVTHDVPTRLHHACSRVSRMRWQRQARLLLGWSPCGRGVPLLSAPSVPPPAADGGRSPAGPSAAAAPCAAYEGPAACLLGGRR
jgi:hypothetical protein